MGLSELLAYFFKLETNSWQAYSLFGLVAATCGFVVSVYRYLRASPEGLEGESPAARRIAQVQRPTWEFRLARQLLRDKLEELDQDCSDLLNCRVYVPLEPCRDPDEYWKWLVNRPKNMKRMITVALNLLIRDFPAALRSTSDEPASPSAIAKETSQIRAFYEDTIRFEREGHAVEPPPEFQRAHALQIGWAKVFRDAVHQLFGFLDRLIALGPSGEGRVEFTIVLETPETMEQYRAELEALEDRIPEILSGV